MVYPPVEKLNSVQSLRSGSNVQCLTGEGKDVSVFRRVKGAQAELFDHYEERVNSTVHDPMVEVDPVTISHQVLLLRQSRLLEQSTPVQISLPPVRQKAKRPNNITLASISVLILLVVAAIIQFRRPNGGRRQNSGDASLINASDPHYAKSKVIKKAKKAADGFVTVTASMKAKTATSHGLASSMQTEKIVMDNLSLEQKLMEGRDSKRLTYQTSHKCHRNEVKAINRPRFDEFSLGCTGSGISMDKNLSNSQTDQADSVENIEECQKHNGRIYASDHMQEQEQALGKEPVKLTPQDAGLPDTTDHNLSSAETDQVESGHSTIQGQAKVTARKALLELAPRDPATYFLSSSYLDSAAKSRIEPLTCSLSSSDQQSTSFQPGPANLTFPTMHNSEIPEYKLVEDVSEKTSEWDPESCNKALEAALPAIIIGVGTIGTLLGVTGGLQVVGFATAASLIFRELLWAQTRDMLWQELNGITDRHKLQQFLKRRKIILRYI